MKQKIIKSFEIGRFVGVILGFYFGYACGDGPREILHVLVPWIVISLAGLTGIEGLFFSDAAAKSMGREPGSPYQKQSGMNNIAIAITALLVYLFDWGFYAEVTILFVLLIFLVLSSINHTVEIFANKNYKLKNILRPAITIALLIYLVPLIISALK
jgi:hypothetical protein